MLTRRMTLATLSDFQSVHNQVLYFTYIHTIDDSWHRHAWLALCSWLPVLCGDTNVSPHTEATVRFSIC